MAYIGFKKLSAKLGSGLAATIGRNKYGKKKFQNAAVEGKKMKGMTSKALGGEVTEEEPTKKDLRRNKRTIRKALRGAGVSRGPARRYARNTAKTTNPWSTKVKQAVPQKIDESDDSMIKYPPSMRKDIIEEEFWNRYKNRKSGGLVGKLRDGGGTDNTEDLSRIKKGSEAASVKIGQDFINARKKDIINIDQEISNSRSPQERINLRKQRDQYALKLEREKNRQAAIVKGRAKVISRQGPGEGKIGSLARGKKSGGLINKLQCL